MATKHQDMQRLIRRYKDETGKTEINMKDVAKYAAAQGWPLPAPVDPLDRLAREFSQAAREEIRYDQTTKRPYRANHAITITQGQDQLHLWIDIDEAKRAPMVKSLVQRREQMVGDGFQLTLDAEHWNRIHEEEEPINLPMDLTDDIQWRKNAPEEDEEAG